jgi:peptidoglycan/LPS O-acetylase OafA/YrhL
LIYDRFDRAHKLWHRGAESCDAEGCFVEGCGMPGRQDESSSQLTVDWAKPAELSPAVSSYLDMLRVVAAMTVLLSHYCPVLFGDLPYPFPGHDAVIIFFVMSGYVIAFVTGSRDTLASQYAIHRLARLWSVLIPSLGLSLVAAIVVGDDSINVAPPVDTPWHFIEASLRTISFTGENWLLADAPAPYNAVVWSLHHEAWYYAIFGVFMFAPQRWRWPASGLVLALAGPGVAALFPCWLLGAWLYWNRERLSLRPACAYAMFVGCIIAYGFAYEFRLTETSRHWLSVLTAGESYHLRAGTSVIGDTLLAPLVAASIVAVDHMPAINRLLVHGRRMMQVASSRTLSLYLFHMPLLAIFHRVGMGRHGGGAIACIVLGVGGSVLLGHVSEARLRAWRSGLSWLYQCFTVRRSRLAALPPLAPPELRSGKLPAASGRTASMDV